MNHIVAYRILATELQTYRDLPFQELCQLVGERSTRCVRGEDGIDYELTIVVHYQLDLGGDIRITGFIGESAWGSPHDTLEDTFIIPKPRHSQ